MIPSTSLSLNCINTVWNRTIKRKGSSQSLTEIKYLEELGPGLERIYMLTHDFLRFSFVVSIQ